MKDEHKTKEQLVNELAELRQRIAALEASETERKRAEEALRESEERIHTIVSNAPVVMWALDKEGIVTLSEGLGLKALGLRPGEVVGQSVSDVYRDVPKILEDNRRALAGESFASIVEVGNLVFESHYSPIRDKSGEVTGMIGVSTDITERVRVEEEIKRRNRELAALNAIATTMMQSALDLDEVLQRTADGIVEGLGCNTAFIFLLDEEEAIFRGGAVSTKAKILERLNAIIGSPLLQIKIPARSDFNEAVSNLLDGRITIRHDFYELVSPLLSRPVCSAMQRLLGSKTFFTMPLLAKGKVVGGIVASTREEISERDTEKLMTFANQAAIAIENARLYEASRRRSEELAALHATSLNITVPHDLPTLLQTIVERAARLLDAPGGGMYLCDPERREVRCVVSYNTPRDYTGTVLKYGEGAAGRVAETGEPLIIDDYRTWSSRAAVYEEEQPFSTVLSAPMIWQDQVTGVIHVLHDVETRRFTQADLELLSLFASQAAIAIENARLYEETRRRALEQETVSYIAYALNTPDVREAFPALAEGLQDLTGCEVVSLIAMDEAGEQFITTVLESPFPILEEGNVMPLSATAAAEDLGAGRPHLTADLSTETHFPLEQALYQAGLRWWVTLSLLVGGEVFGGLSLGGSDTGLFREDQLPVLRQIADAVALALQNSFIFLAEREQRELAESLEDATAALTATLDFDQVLDRILEQVSRVVPNDATNIMLIEGDQAHIVRWRGYERFGDEEFASTAVFHLPERATLQQMVETRKPTVVPDTTTGPDWVHVPVQEWLRSYAAAPIIVRGEVIGFLNVDSATPGFFTPDHAKILRAFATHAATAIENARLYEAERKRRAELEALRQASLHLASTLELQPILEAILEHALKLVAADDAHVFLYDGERLAFGVALWEDGRQQEPFAEPRPRGLTYTVARSGERIVAPDANSHPLFRDYQWGGAIVGLPLRIGERVVGVMNVAFERPHVFDESELRVLGLLADQAAIAIENARLYEETQQRALEQETLREAALALTTALNRNEVIDRILAQLQQVVPYDSASVQLLKGDRMEIVGGRGFPNLPDLLGISFPAHGDNPNSEVIRTQAPFIVDDAPAVYEDFSKEPFAAMGIRSWLGVPMLVGERLVGMIALDKCQPGFYTQEHARLAEAFAAQAAVAVENARLFEEEKRRATQLALINEVGEKAVSILDSDRLMQEVTRSIQASFNYYNVALLLLDEERGEVVMQAVTGGFEHLVPGEYRQSTDEGIIGFAARTGKSRLANDISKDPYYTKGFMGEVLTKSELCVPIKLGDKVIGALDVQSIHLNDFEQADVVAMEAVANRLAMGIQNARLYEEVAGLYDVGLAVSSALELDKTLRAIYEQVNRLMSPDTFYVALYDEARGELRFEIFIEEGQWLPKFTRKLDEGSLTAWIVQARESLFIGDIEKERESLPATPSQKGKPGTRSWMGFPLVARDKVVGVISVQSFRPHAFTEGNKRILSAFANQAAIAIENARLYEETKRRAEEMTALHETALDITAKLEMQHLLSAIITRASDLLGATGGLVHLYDPAREKLVAVTSHNLERDYTGLTLEVGEGVAGKVFQTGEALIIDDHCAWAGKSPQVEDAFARSMLGVPLRWREQVIGGLDIMDNERVGAFDEEDLGLLTLFANQAAIAIENAHLFEETERLKTFNENVVQGVAEAILIEDAQGVITFANPAAEELLGYTREELIGRRWTTIVPEEQVEKVRQETAKRPQGTVGRYETALLSKEGQVIPVIVSARPLFEEGKFAGILSAFIDIRERVRREREIEERRLYLEGVLGAAPDAIVTLDAHHRVVEWNAGAERLFGYSQEEVIGQNIDDLITGPDVLEEAVGFTQRVMGGGEVPPTEIVRYRKDGSPVDVIVAGSPIMVGDELIGTVVVYTDITVRVRMEETLRALALLDELTSLYNRRGFFTLAEQQLKMADRTETKMLLLFADFDDLKWINDTLGHHEGDRALIEVANVLAETFRESDIIGRIGGDEFVVLAIETDGSPAEVLTARLQENLEARNARGDLRYRLSLSVGIAHYDPGHPCSIDELLAQADRSMYEKKQDNGVIASCSMSHSRHS